MIKVKIGEKIRNIVKIDFYVEEEGRLAKKTITLITDGDKIVFQGVRSCFGSGKWIGKKPWLGKDKWKGK